MEYSYGHGLQIRASGGVNQDKLFLLKLYSVLY